MGLFPQIDRAWIALNNKLFLWDYVTSYVLVRISCASSSDVKPPIQEGFSTKFPRAAKQHYKCWHYKTEAWSVCLLSTYGALT